jgi:hypothetical protein
MKTQFVFFAVMLTAGLFASCQNPVSNTNKTPVETPEYTTPSADGNTYIKFDNTQGVCTVIVYDHSQRRDTDIIEVVRAGASSGQRNWTASEMQSFFLSFQFPVPGAEETTVIYTPASVEKNQILARIDSGKITSIRIPKLEDTLLSRQDLLSGDSYLIIQNDASYSFNLQRGASLIKPENLGGMVVNAGEKALYKVEGGAAASAYTLLVGASSVNFPASPAQFAAGHVYRFVYTGGSPLTARGSTQLDVTTVAAQGQSGGDIPAVPAGLVVTGVTQDSVSLSWNAVSGANGYRIYRSPSADGAFFQIGSRAAAQTPSYTDSGLAPSTVYYYKVSAVNVVGESAMSAAIMSDGKCTVTILNLSGAVTAPVKNAIPETILPELNNDQYTVTGITWQTVSGDAVSDVFATGVAYKAILRLQAQDAYTFAGLGSNVFTFSGATSVTAAVTGQTATVTVTFPELGRVDLSAGTADEFFDKLSWIKSNGEPDTYYVITLTANISLSPQTLNADLSSRLRSTTVKITGEGSVKAITLNANGSLFTLKGYNEVNKFTFILDENVRLQGKSNNTASVVTVNQYAEFIMQGGTISGNTSSSYGGGVYVSSGTFTMSGGTISSNNTSSSYGGGGGGVYVSSGTFTMSGGTISGNTSSSSSGRGGGVYVNSSTFTMSGGTISGNTACYGGGVFSSGGRFTKSGDSIIYGNDAPTTSKNTASGGSGHAVNVNNGSKNRNTTALPVDTMDSDLSGAAGGWE